ncbi:MAG: hypothetical protein HC935_08635 [Pseudanabaena sp. SU_2_4]|nr:hypothetical protein [Pseudanabaena sp. SU_2_4]
MGNEVKLLGWAIEALCEDLDDVWKKTVGIEDTDGILDICRGNFDEFQKLSLYLVLLNVTQQDAIEIINQILNKGNPGKSKKIGTLRTSWSTGIFHAVEKTSHFSSKNRKQGEN